MDEATVDEAADEAADGAGDREGKKPHVWAIIALKTHSIQRIITRCVPRTDLVYVCATDARSFPLAQPTMCVDPWLTLERT